MENKNLKNIFIAAGLAVFIGVLTLGVNAAFGISSPTQDPSNAALHSPVFNSVDVQNEIKNTSGNNSGNVRINDNFDVGGDAQFLGKAQVAGNLHAWGGLNVNTGLTVAGNALFGDNIDILGIIENSNYNKVKIQDDLEVTGTANIKGQTNLDSSLYIKGDIGNVNNIYTNFNDPTQGNLFLNGYIKNNSLLDKAVTIDDDLVVNKGLGVMGDFGVTGAALFLKGLIANVGIATKDLTAGGTTNLLGDVFIGKDKWLTVDKITSSEPGVGKPIVINTPITAVKDNSGYGQLNVDVNLAIKNGYGLTVDGGTTLNGGATIPSGQSLKLPSGDGKIKNADGNNILQTWWSNTFGDYTAINSGYAWTGSEPVSVVAGAYGVFFMKGNNGSAYQTQLGKIDLDGNLKFLGTYAKSVGGTNRAVYVDNNGNIGTLASSERFKDNIKDMEDISWLYRLHPVNFIYKNDANKEKQYGLIAEEVEKVNEDLVTYDENEKAYSVLYNNLIGPVIKALQEQKREIAKLRAENTEIKKALCEIKPDLKLCKSL